MVEVMKGAVKEEGGGGALICMAPTCTGRDGHKGKGLSVCLLHALYSSHGPIPWYCLPGTQDLIKLRQNDWNPRRSVDSPKKLAEVNKDFPQPTYAAWHGGLWF